MPNYNPALTASLWVGATLVLADSTLQSPFTSQAVAIGRDPGSDQSITVYNPSTLPATVQAAAVDADANYLPFGSAPAGQATKISAPGDFVRLSFTAAPSAAVSVTR